jgi:tetratricopeptide (TPR) repeat protein
LLLASAFAAGLMMPAPASAITRLDPPRIYLAARAAAIEGDHGRSAQLLAQLVEISAANQSVAKEAVAQAISAGDMKLALRLMKNLPETSTPVEGRFLQVAEALRANDSSRALALLQGGSVATNIGFLRPFVAAWTAADARDLPRALAALNSLSPRDLLAGLAPEQRALILLKFRRIADADPYVAQALKVGGGREQRMRLAFADSYLALGDRARALSMVAGLGPEAERARARVLAGKFGGARIDNARTAFSEVLIVLAAELNRLHNQSMPVALTQIARYTAPENSATAIMLGLTLDDRDRVDDAIAAFRAVRADDALATQARDAEVRALRGADRDQEALQAAQRALAADATDPTSHARLGEVLADLGRHEEAAAAYGRALQVSGQGAKAETRWPLLLLRASALEEGGRWAEARHDLTQALALAPDEPVILNFLGYAKLERGEDLDVAEAMIRKASALAPDDASITDSLGWALYKRGRLDEAVEVLSRAAKADPTQAEIREHLGDALYKAGNRFEARYAWSAALVTADDEIAGRVKAKLEAGLTPATAAP